MIPCTPFFWFEKPSNPGYQSTWGIWTCSFWTLIAKVHRLLHTLWRYAPVQEKSQSLNLINLRGHLYQDAGKERKVIFQPQIDGKWKIVSLQDEFSLVRFPQKSWIVWERGGIFQAPKFSHDIPIYPWKLTAGTRSHQGLVQMMGPFPNRWSSGSIVWIYLVVSTHLKNIIRFR